MKRNKILCFLFVVIAVIMISGCSSPSATRDTLKVDKALVGHWVNAIGNPDLYFSGTELIKVEKDGSTTNMTYEVLETNDNANTITIRVTDPTKVINESTSNIKFSTDKKTMTVSGTLFGVAYNEDDYNYGDSKTKP